MAEASGPLPWMCATPFAHAVHDRALRRGKRERPLRVELARAHAVGVAPVDLEIVDAPFGEPRRVAKLVAQAARILRAGHGPGVGVHPEPQAAGMDLVGQCLHSGGELRAVGQHVAVCGAPLLAPAVIDDDVAIAGGAHAGVEERLGRLADDRLVDPAFEAIPGVPAHRWCGRESVAQLAQPHGLGL